MEFKEIFSKKRIIFLVIFVVMIFLGKKINFSPVIGAENQFFTLFQFFGPIAGSFLGPIFGMISVLLADFGNFLLVGKVWSVVNLIRLAPMLFAAYYFGSKKKKLSMVIPLVCMVLFIAHPVGREVWFFSLYWLIPVVVKLVKKAPGELFFKSLGATFTAHAIGSTAWLYTVPMTAGQWIGLIPVVAYERLLFAIGIAGSYVVVNTVLDIVVEKFKLRIPSDILHLDKKYVVFKRVFGIKA